MLCSIRIWIHIPECLFLVSCTAVFAIWRSRGDLGGRLGGVGLRLRCLHNNDCGFSVYSIVDFLYIQLNIFSVYLIVNFRFLSNLFFMIHPFKNIKKISIENTKTSLKIHNNFSSSVYFFYLNLSRSSF